MCPFCRLKTKTGLQVTRVYIWTGHSFVLWVAKGGHSLILLFLCPLKYFVKDTWKTVIHGVAVSKVSRLLPVCLCEKLRKH